MKEQSFKEKMALKKGGVSPAKAEKILHEGEAKWHPLTEKQRKFFGARASGYPVKRKNMGGYILGGDIKDILKKLNLRIKPEDGAIKFEGSYNDFEFHGIADKNEIDMDGKYKGIDFSVQMNYENFVNNISSE